MGQNLKPAELPRRCYRVNVSRSESLISRTAEVVLVPKPRFADAGDGGTGVGAGAGSKIGASAGPIP